MEGVESSLLWETVKDAEWLPHPFQQRFPFARIACGVCGVKSEKKFFGFTGSPGNGSICLEAYQIAYTEYPAVSAHGNARSEMESGVTAG